ncbi:hypothetical protein [Shewanella glacialipiscicola]|uniref:hypothetical protein n=1 Tax=Shewanella glacialipiscicola TaxID=614069 RepID=UPI003D7B6167
MQNPQYSTHHIYQHIQGLINNLLNDLKLESNDVDTQDTTAYSQELLNNLYNDISNKLVELEKHAEWNTFTIALYGETNAGKSTIIETLRILLGEETKKQQQAQFAQWQQDAGISVDSVDQARQTILFTEQQLEQQDLSWHHKQLQLKQQVSLCEQQHKDAQHIWTQLKQSVSLLQRFIWIFKTCAEASAVKITHADLVNVNEALTVQTQQHTNVRDSVAADLKQIEASYQDMANKIKQAEPYADGGIIGNGQSDFTLETQSYSFNINGCKFNLLDVPGIEGKESKVTDAIWQAVHKAHAVFYITSKASAPQKGDDKNPGTVEKIKQHLDAQSEVWTIFNKRIQNPIQLEKDQLISAGELESLADLDAKMSEFLGDNYQKTLALSAYPAFLAAASCLLPDSRDRIVQKKFLTQFSVEQILEKSNISVLSNMFTQDLVDEFNVKIMRSNHRKAKMVVNATRNNVVALRREKYAPLLIKLRDELSATNTEFTTSVKTLHVKLSNNTRELIRVFESSVRDPMYAKIERDISNDELKQLLKNQIEQCQQDLIDKLPNMVSLEINRFETKIDDIVSRFESHTNTLMATFNNIDSTNIELDINIDNGINVWGIVGAVGGGALLMFTPMGWALLAISASTLVFQAYKALRSFFSNSYKFSQQRQSVEENIDKISDRISVQITGNLNSVMEDVELNVKRISDAMGHSINSIELINKKLAESQRELDALCLQLEN